MLLLPGRYRPELPDYQGALEGAALTSTQIPSTCRSFDIRYFKGGYFSKVGVSFHHLKVRLWFGIHTFGGFSGYKFNYQTQKTYITGSPHRKTQLLQTGAVKKPLPGTELQTANRQFVKPTVDSMSMRCSSILMSNGMARRFSFIRGSCSPHSPPAFFPKSPKS